MKSWRSLLFGGAADKQPATAPHDDHDAYCSFCRKHRREVAKLIAAPGALICDDCIALCVRTLDEETPSAHYYAELVLQNLTACSRDTPHAFVTPRFRAVVELAAGEAAILRRLAGRALGFEDRATALSALAAIPEDRRTIDDRLDTAALLSDSERHAEAFAALDAIDTSALVGVELIRYKLCRAFAEIERGDCTRVRLAVHRKTALDVEPDVAALPRGGFEDALRAERLVVLTLALLGLGELEAAELAARERITWQPENAAAAEILGRVLEARGDREGAAVERRNALARAHPDGALAKKLRGIATAAAPVGDTRGRHE
jgi:hypothetical protein